ncbi:hypothetical protein B0H10DRAFT_1975149, partial [Mycena sp. CBHHK59/15]
RHPDEYKRHRTHRMGRCSCSTAVERNLQFWKTGSTRPDRAAWPFSFDNWGDIRTRESKTKTKLCAARPVLHVLKKWDETRWEELRERQLSGRNGRRTASSSRGTSEAEDMEETEEEGARRMSDSALRRSTALYGRPVMESYAPFRMIQPIESSLSILRTASSKSLALSKTQYIYRAFQRHMSYLRL